MHAFRRNFRSPAALLLFFGTTIIGLGVDLWTKHIAFDYLVERVILDPDGSVHVVAKRDPLVQPDGTVRAVEREVRFIPGLLHFRATANIGAVFGIGQGKRWLFIVVSVLAIGFLTYLFASSAPSRLYQFILGLLLGGVLGNMYDRVTLGYVRDMLYALPRWPNLFPWIFNVADSLLCIGVFLLIVYSMFHSPDEEPRGSERTLAADERR